MLIVETISALCMRHLKDVNGEPIVNKIECPLLQLKLDLCLISTTCILSPVSVVHSRGSSCTFINSPTTQHIKREPVDIQKLTFCHNLLNYIYCYNIFCTNNLF